MKILILLSSQRKQGNTDNVVDLLSDNLKTEASLKKTAIEIEKIYLGDLEIAPCRGCRVCFDRGEQFCPLKDDLLTVKEKMKAADGIILASPVYVDDINGIMKNWIDRLAHVCHRPEFAGKSAYLLVTVGSSRTSHALRTLDTALRTWGIYIIGTAGFKTLATMETQEIHKLFDKKIAQIGQKIIRDIEQKKSDDPSFISLMIFKIQQIGWSRAAKDHIDYQYWSNQGWLNPRQTFFIKHKAGALKVGSARLVGSIVARFMI